MLAAALGKRQPQGFSSEGSDRIELHSCSTVTLGQVAGQFLRAMRAR